MRNLFCAAMLIAAPLTAQTGILVDSNLDELFFVDLTTGGVILIGSTANNGLTVPADLTWREDTRELYTIDLSGGEVGTLDVGTGTFTPLFQTNMSGWQGMAWDPETRLFYLANQSDDNYVLDPVTGTLTLLGNSGFGLLTCLEVDAQGRLWGIDFFSGDIVEIDKTTGAGTSVATTMTGYQGLGLDENGNWFGANTNTDSLDFIDQTSGYVVTIGPNPGIGFAKGFEVLDTWQMRGGVPCVDGNGQARRINVSGGAGQLGTTLDVTVDAGSSAFPVSIMLGFSASRLGGAPLLPLDLSIIGAPGCFLYQSLNAVLGQVPTGTPLQVQVSTDPVFIGTQLVLQGAVVDQSGSGNPLGFAFTDFVRVVIS